MDWDRDLRRTQSLKNIPTWTEPGLRDKTTSVSQLVARYQNAVKNKSFSRSAAGEAGGEKTKQVLNEKTPSPLQIPERHLETLMRRNDERERTRTDISFSRSKSMSSLQTSTGSIEALRAVFESKAPAQRNVKRNFKTANATLSPTAVMMNGEDEEVQGAAEEQKTPAGSKAGREDYETQRAVNQTQMERRKTIAGIDFEKIAASEADDRRRTIADFRDNSFIQTKEILSVSVKAMSALYMSKVATQDSTRSISKMEQDQPHEFEKKAKLTKMEEDSQQKMDDPPPLQPEQLETGLEDTSGEQPQQSQLFKQTLYQQRQKNELRRLLKHTHPELKTLEDVDEEFAEVLSSERLTADDTTGYEGEILSRCLIFENRGSGSNMSPYTSKSHMAEGAVGRCDCSQTLTVPERSKEKALVPEIIEDDNSLDSRSDLTKQAEEEMTRVDVKATRSLFETPCKPNASTIQGGVKVQQPNKLSKISKNTNTDLKEQCQEWCGQVGPRTELDNSGREDFRGHKLLFEDDFTSSDSESHSEIIKTSASLFQNNPFISTNIERENSSGHASKSPNETGATGEDYLTANVKNRTYLFESMPFDKIRHQNRDEVETMVEIIKETLDFLYRVKAIQSAGAIIEINDTMIAKKAKFTISEHGPEIKYDEVAEGGAQNFILQLLPRVNLKPQITYLKEDSKGSIVVTTMDVLVHHRQVNLTKNTEFKTANVVQLVEDILNQDNSLRKGVIIQDNVNNWAEVIVYSLYKYLNSEEVKSYSPPISLDFNETDVMTKTDDETKTYYTASTIGSLQETTEDQTCSESSRPNVRVNVKLFTSCIEKGDLEYLKTLQDDEPEVQMNEVSQNQTVVGQNDESHEQKSNQTEEDSSNYCPINVKKLKRIFSEDKSYNPTSISNTSFRKYQSSTECNIEPYQQPNNTLRKSGGQEAKEDVPRDDDRVHQAKPANVLDDTNDPSDLQTAIQNLQQVTKEAKMFHHSLQDPQNICPEESTVKPSDANTAVNRISQDNVDPQEKSCFEMSLNKIPLDSDVASGHELDWKHQTAERCPEDDSEEKEKTAETCAEIVPNQHFQTTVTSLNSLEKPPAPEEEEVVFQGKIQAALNSLEKSNINVARGDFKAAMIYRNSSKSHQRLSQDDETPTTKEFFHVAELESTKISPKQEVTGTMQKPTNAVSQKNKRPTGPKPPLPPKPEHLKVKQDDLAKNPETIHSSTVKTKETVPQDSQSSTTENKQHLFTSTNMSTGHQSKVLLGNSTHVLQKIKVTDQVQDSTRALEIFETDKNIVNKQLEMSVAGKENVPQNTSEKDVNEMDENHIDFHEACRKFEIKKAFSVKTAPVKPKRQRGAHFDNKQQQRDLPEANSGAPPVLEQMNPNTVDAMTSPSSNTSGISAEMSNSKVEMREKKGRAETEDERRQRLSVHMDGIMRGNETTAMEIFDNLRKQEELQRILSRVEEIEQDTSNVDVKSLRRAFENVRSDRKKPKRVKPESNEKPAQSPVNRTESKSSMEHVYGDLARASEEIINLKEQTVARLKDIEDAIMKALYSVSTLKSDSDIASLSCLFKESLGNVQVPWSSGNVSKTDTSSSKMKSHQSFINQGDTNSQTTQCASTETSSAKQSPPPSPASGANRTDEALPPEASVCLRCEPNPKPEERFRTTKMVTCNSCVQSEKPDEGKQSHSPQNRELSVLKLQTDSEGNSIMGTEIVSDNCERTDEFGNKVYTSRTCTVLNTQPDTGTSPTVTNPSTCQFQPACRETCSACQKPVYQMEKIAADKYVFHKTCFCCKKCMKKLSMYSYAPLNGEFYCVFHYQQLFKRKGNYDEGFGRTQHKNKWLLRSASSGATNESEA